MKFKLLLSLVISACISIQVQTIKAQATIAADINVGASNSSPQQLEVVNGNLYFNAFEPSAGQEPRFFNGTSVSLLSDIRTGTTGSGSFSYFAAIGSDVYFQANNGVTGAELWKWNGVTATLAADITPGAGGSNPRGMIAYGGKIYFDANNQFYSFDGTTAVLIGGGITNAQQFAVYAGKLFFAATSTGTGTELYSYNGTSLVLEADIIPGSLSSTPQQLFVYGSRLYFNASNGTSGQELFSFDGTTAALAADIVPGSGSGNPAFFAELGGNLYFRATNAANGTEL